MDAAQCEMHEWCLEDSEQRERQEDSGVGVGYGIWEEKWPWMVEKERCFVRFDRLLPAMQYARERDAHDAVTTPRGADGVIWKRNCTTTSGHNPSTRSGLGAAVQKTPIPCSIAFPSTGASVVRNRIVRVFSEERPTVDGSRYVWSFFAADYVSLWKRMSARKLKNVHCYEIIEEGQPCHLYFDLEFLKEFNGGLDGNALVCRLIRELGRVLKRRWGLCLRDAFVMEMDASTKDKFSRHLIVRFDGCAFRGNTHMKPVIQEIVHNAPSGYFTVNKEGGTCSFIDEAVYSKHGL